MSEEILFGQTKHNVPMQDFFATGAQAVDKFDSRCWQTGSGFAIPGFPMMDDKLEGLEAGLYLVAGESNSGKSALMKNLLYQIATHETNSLYGIYVSLDDSSEDIMARCIAMTQQIPIAVCSKPGRFQEKIAAGDPGAANLQDWLNRREQGLEQLRIDARRFRIIDAEEIQNAEQLYQYIKTVQIFIKAQDPTANVIVAIDSLSDIRFADERLKPGKELNDHIAQTVKRWAVTDFKIPIFGSVHLRKLNNNRRPNLDDLKESGEYVYEASVVWLVHNDVSRNKQIANIYFSQEDSEEKYPILEVDWAKNKKSSYKGRTYHYFVPNHSLVSECPAETMSRYDALVYEV